MNGTHGRGAQPLRILFVNRMASLERGGGETFDLEISRHLEAMDCQISYLTGLPIFTGAKTPIRHPRSFTIRSPYFGWFPWDVVRGGWRLRVADFQMFERAAFRWARARAGQFDVIQVCELPTFAALWSRTGICPVVMRLTAPNFIDPLGGLKKADRVMASGTSIEKVRAGPRPDCADIPNGVDTERFRPQNSTFRASHGIGEKDTVLLYVARFQAFKNHAVLVQAFREIQQNAPEARLVLAGSGPLRERTEQLCRTLGVQARVLFLGEVPFEELPKVYAAADLKVISSDYESFCFAAIEAMASGLPVVTTDCGWVPGLLGAGEGGTMGPWDHGTMGPGMGGEEAKGSINSQFSTHTSQSINSQFSTHNSQGRTGAPSSPFRRAPGGLITPVGGAELFADACLELLRNPGERKRMGAWNRARAVERHGWEASAKRLLGLYEELLVERSESSN